MRLRRLDLLRYGHFTDCSFELPPAGIDLHVIFGPNEAGKSTALCAIEDLLFGVPERSPYGFLHDYSSMRIGALVENTRASIEVVRRKGRRDTLLGADDSPAAGGEGALNPFLAGVDRSSFQRMFSLDHVRLEMGGREILEAEGEVGQTIFSAGTGIENLRDRLAQLSKEADALWAPRRAVRRKYYQADDKLQDARTRLREQTLSTEKWLERKRGFEKAQEDYAEIEADFEKASAEGRKINRIRRVYRHIRHKTELDERIEALGEVVVLPEDARQILEESERKESDLSVRIDTLSGQAQTARKELESLVCDERLILHADDVQYLHERRIEIRSEKADLPKRRAELGAAERELRSLASDLDWRAEKVSTLIDRMPARPKVSVVRSLVGRHGELAAEVSNRREALKEAEAKRAELQKRLDAVGKARDVSGLEAVVKSIRESGDVAGRLHTARQGVEDAQERVRRRLEALHPSLPDEKDAATMRVPAQAEVQRHRDRVQDWERRTRETGQSVAAVEQDLARDRRALERIVQDEGAVSADELRHARDGRDRLWRLVQHRYIEHTPIPDEEARACADALRDIPGSFERAMQSADALADRRFDRAEATARLAEISRGIDSNEERLAELCIQKEKIEDEGEGLDRQWLTMWEGAPVAPLGPDAMLEWLDARDDLLEALERRAEAVSALETLLTEERQAREGLLAELVALAIDRTKLENDALPVILEHADRIRRDHEQRAQTRAQLQQEVGDAEVDVKRCGRALGHAKEAWSKWQGQWSVALSALGLATDSQPEAVAAQLDVIEHMREKAVRINDLRHQRIDKINQDIADFESVVAEFVQKLTEDLSSATADDAVSEVKRRLDEATRIRDRQTSKKKEVGKLEAQITEMEQARRKARESVKHLEDAAGVGTMDDLKKPIERSDTLRALQQELDETLTTLAQEGDGLPVDRLVEECAAIDVDRIAAQEETNTAAQHELRRQWTAAVETLSQTREAFQAIGGDDAAARAEADRQEALAEIRQVAERYVRVRGTTLLLQWAIDRYRREKQDPLLRRAGELFKTITGGSFSALRVDYDSQDRPYLTGLRPDNQVVPVPGMSTGTTDQLYLALRVASMEHYLDRADALPFIADDLFVNFDNDRAGAGFEVLGELARRTQVLFFTHHQHLVNIARKSLGDSLSVVHL